MRRHDIVLGVAIAIGALSLACGNSLAAIPASGGSSSQLTTQVPCGKSISAQRPAANSTLELQSGCTYTGTLAITANYVTVTSYGTGSPPVLTLSRNGETIDVEGSNDTIEGLSLVGQAPRTWNCDGARTPDGHVDGIDIEGGALDNTVTNVSATGFYAAVFIMAGSSGNVIENSTFTNNTMLDTNDENGSSGAFGVLLWGNGNTIQFNTISGNQACSIAYGYDGSAIEVYGGSNNLVANNQTSNNNAFTELGSYPGSIATSNTYQNNAVSDGTGGLGSSFLVTRGSGDPDGPVYNTVAENNTVNLTLPGDEGAVSYAWQRGDGTLLTLTGNYLNLGGNQVLYEDGGYVNGGGNTFIGRCNPASAC
ncbi:MAG TPA: hypothetical protein VMA95_20715 [Streptosporangiaceae bacterium]|nr:hypothetical protein [Streptosporangiaceae bacterium]